MAAKIEDVAKSLAEGSVIHQNALLHSGVVEDALVAALDALGFDLIKDPLTKNCTARKQAGSDTDAKS